MENKKITRLIVSFFIALALWVYVINTVNPTATVALRNIPVTLTNEDILVENKLAIAGSGEYTVDVYISAPRKDLASIVADNLVATADVSELTLGQDYITVEVQAPKGYTVSDIRSRKIQVYVEHLVTATVPVEVQSSALSGSYETTIIKTYPETVEISGAESLISNACKYVVSLDSDKLSYEEVSELTLEGHAEDDQGNHIAGLNYSVNAVAIDATIYSTKTVSLVTSTTGEVWKGATVLGIKAPTKINIKGPSDLITEISSVECKSVSIEGIFEDLQEELEPKLPKGVYITDDSEELVINVDMADTGSISFTYGVNAIVSRNISSEVHHVSYALGQNEEAIIVSVSGPVDALKTVSASDITVYTDLGNLNSAGIYTVKLYAETQIEGLTITVDPEIITATLKKK